MSSVTHTPHFLFSQGSGRGYADGLGDAVMFDGMRGISYHAGALYIGENSNPVIRKFDISTGETTRVTGLKNAEGWQDGSTPVTRFKSIRGIIATGSPTGGVTIYSASKMIRKTDVESGMTSTIGARTVASGAVIDGSSFDATINYNDGVRTNTKTQTRTRARTHTHTHADA
jgi:hypothetical protein